MSRTSSRWFRELVSQIYLYLDPARRRPLQPVPLRIRVDSDRGEPIAGQGYGRFHG